MRARFGPRIVALALVSIAVSIAASDARAVFAPRIAVVLSREGVALSSYIPQRTGHGWLGVAALAGVPYATLFVDELEEDGAALAGEYGALVLPELHALSDGNYERLTQTLIAYRAAGGAVLLDGPPGIWDEAGGWRGDGPLHAALDCALGGFVGDSRCHVTIADAAGGAHFITRGWSEGEAVTPPFTIGFNALIAKPRAGIDAGVLLEARGAGKSHPWLSYVQSGASRVVLIGGVFGAGDAASIFRNGADRVPDPPNRVYDILVAALQWALYGDAPGPIPALQFCAADAAVLIRLDGDHSNRSEDVAHTFSYLTDIAEESGVAAAYGIVTGRAAETGWAGFAPLAKRLEERGGEIGTHTHSHDIYRVLDEEIAFRELDESVRAIDHDLTAAGYDAEGVPFLINPNGMIPMTAYPIIASRFPLFLTHGISSSVPVAYGVSTWFARSDPPFTVIYDSPVPDFQWLYERNWSYTAEEAADLQCAILNHYARSIRRGVLFDMMWHDYGIASSGEDQARLHFRWADLFKPARKKSASNLPLFDAMRAMFRALPIYCPEPLEAADKLRIMQRAEYSWTAGEHAMEMTLDLTGFDEETVRSMAGMGIRIDRTSAPIESVAIDGRPHAAFRIPGDGGDDNVVIVPALSAGKHVIEVTFGDHPGRPRLTHVSKPLLSIEQNLHGGELQFSIDSESLVRLDLEADGSWPYLVGADGFRTRGRPGACALSGTKLGGGTFTLRTIPPGFPRIVRAEGPVLACDRTGNDVYSITFGSHAGGDMAVEFQDERALRLRGPDGQTLTAVRQADFRQTFMVPGSARETRFTLTREDGP